jgi:hypothetical protein
MNRHRLARSAALGLALAAVAASAASANIVDLRSADAREASRAAYARQGQPRQDLRSADTRDHAAGRGTFSAPEVTVVKVTGPAPPSAGIHWGDAGIGAGGMLGLILLALGISLAAVHHRRSAATGQAATTA